MSLATRQTMKTTEINKTVETENERESKYTNTWTTHTNMKK